MRLMRGMELNHIGLFSFGLLFYWVLPLLMQPDAPLFPTLSNATIRGALIVMLAIYSAFLVGDQAGKMLRYRPSPARSLTGFPIILGFLWVVAGFFVVLKRNELFIPYAENLARGTLTTLTLLFLALALLRASSREEFQLKNAYFVSYFSLSALLLIMGQRLYFVTGLLVLAVYRSCYFARLRARHLVLGCLGGLAIVLSIGVLRAGDGTYGLQSLATNLLSEPTYTAISLFDYLKYHNLPAVGLPTSLLFKFGNLVPSFLFPSKAELFINTDVYSPIGANNSFIGWMTNFGIAGSLVLAAVLGFMFRWLRAKDNCIARLIYPLLSAWLAFSFFRDDFAISIVKNMIESSVILPCGMFLVTASLAALPFRCCFLSKSQFSFRRWRSSVRNSTV